MKCIRKKVEEELDRGNIGPNLSCPYHPTHFKGQNCSFCYCPFYPCHDESLGENITTVNGKVVWSCLYCTLIHRDAAVAYVFDHLNKADLDDEGKLKEALEGTKRAVSNREVILVEGKDPVKRMEIAIKLSKELNSMGFSVAPMIPIDIDGEMKEILGDKSVSAETFELGEAAGLSQPLIFNNPVHAAVSDDGTAAVTVCGKTKTLRLGSDSVKALYGLFEDEIRGAREFLSSRYDYVVILGQRPSYYSEEIEVLSPTFVIESDLGLTIEGTKTESYDDEDDFILYLRGKEY